MKTDISLTYRIKAQKQKETYVLFAVTLLFRKKRDQVFSVCFLSHLKSMWGKCWLYWKSSNTVRKILSLLLLLLLFWSELAAVVYESSRSAIDGLARWE